MKVTHSKEKSVGILLSEELHYRVDDPPFYFIFSPLSGWRVFLITGGIFIEGRVEVWPGLHQVAPASHPVHAFVS